jgi:hypothetical protein
MDRKYYILWYRLNGRDSYLIWYSNEIDGVFVDEDDFVPSFNDTHSLLKHANERGISVEAEGPILLNLDVIGKWLNEKDVGLIDPHSFNGAWNLFDDVSRSIKGSFDADPQLTQKMYDKLFWGCNLPSVTPERAQYHPSWMPHELKIMRDVLDAGLQMFQRSIRRL